MWCDGAYPWWGNAADQIVAVLPVSHFDRICIDLKDVSERDRENSRTVLEYLLRWLSEHSSSESPDRQT